MPNADEHAPAAANGGQQPPKPAAALGSLTTGDAMTGTATDLGTFSWADRTGGQLSAAERRSLLRPLAQGLAVNAAGRLLMLDGRAMEWSEIGIARNPTCPVCAGRT